MPFRRPCEDDIPAIKPWSERCKENHIPFARSGAEIKNSDLALWRALSQQILDGSKYVATHELFQQIVLVIHSLYASR